MTAAQHDDMHHMSSMGQLQWNVLTLRLMVIMMTTWQTQQVEAI